MKLNLLGRMVDPGFPWWVTTAVAGGVVVACLVVLWRARRLRAGAAAVGLVAVAVGALAPVVMGTGSDASGLAMEAEGGLGPNRPFAELRVVTGPGQIDHVDPALSYLTMSWQALWRVYIPLLTYKPVSGPGGSAVVPGLARSLPVISADGKRYTVKLRPGLKYATGAPVKASDFQRAIERLFLMGSPGAGYYSGLVGAERFAETKRGQIAGIVADDAKGTIVFRLGRPRGDFSNILALPFAAPVPEGAPARDQSSDPIPGTGPYTVASYRPGRSLTLVRNAYFRPTPWIPRGNPDRVSAQIVADESTSVRMVTGGRADWNGTMPVERLAEARAEYPDRVRMNTEAGTMYFFMNTRTPPFDKPELRRSVNHAIDRDAIVKKALGGMGRPTQNVLPPAYPAFRELTLYPHDPAKARALVRQAGASGAEVTVWGMAGEGPLNKAAVYLTGVLRSIGLKPTLKLVDSSTYFATIGSQKTKAQIGASVWSQDYPHPISWFDPLLNGKSIAETNNYNLANANDPRLNGLIDDLRDELRLTSTVNAKWARADRLAVENAFWAPFANMTAVDFFSDRVDFGCYVHHVVYRFDWSQICVK
jgi:peptide/nickel transport system substrate-binding protein